MQLHAITIIRKRGQMTLPDEFRKAMEWLTPESVISLFSIKDDEIIIKPYSAIKKYNAKIVWSAIKKARSIQGKGGNLSAFIAKDRLTHF